jgi:hypothetical protein
MKTKALDVNKKKRNSPFPSKVYMQINPHSYGGFYLFLLSIYNKIGDDGAGRLAEVLVRCPALARLVLWYNQVGNARDREFCRSAVAVHRADSLYGHLPLLAHCHLFRRQTSVYF